MQNGGRKYESIRQIASGGMGSVALAVRQEGAFRRVYAIKRLRSAYRDDARVRSMFLEEARIAGLLHHPNVVSVVDVGEDEDGPYLVMDYVQGVSLAELIGYSRDQNELIPVQLCVRLIKQAAEGLHAAHELCDHDGNPLHLVHRDVSPQNVLIGYDGVARLTDFGIAKAAGGVSETATGILKGKFGYMAPEQLQFEKPSRRSDLFSLGVMLYETLSARRLYEGEDQREVAKRILDDSPPDIDEIRSDVHPSLVELLYDLLVKDPNERPATAAEVVHRLDAILADLVLSEEPIALGPYVVSRFEGRRAQQQAEIDELTESFVLGRLSSAPPARRARPVMSIALVAMALAAAWLVWLTRQNIEATVPNATPQEVEPTPMVVLNPSSTEQVPAASAKPPEPAGPAATTADAEPGPTAKPKSRRPRRDKRTSTGPTEPPRRSTDEYMGWGE